MWVSSNFQKDIYQNVITKTFPSLNAYDKELLQYYLISLINVIAILFDFESGPIAEFEMQLKQNNYRDLIALMLLILPFINDDDLSKKKMITSFSDIFIEKKKKVNINKEEPQYVYSNIQYARCIRSDIAKERAFDKEYLDHNFILLVETLRHVSNKLYINWLDVLPYSLGSVAKTKLYQDTDSRYKSNSLTDWVATTVDLNLDEIPGGLSMHDIYDTISNEFYHGIKNFKWVIYDTIVERSVTEELGNLEPIPLLVACNYLFVMSGCTNNIRWKSLNDSSREEFTLRWNQFVDMLYNKSDFITTEINIGNLSLLNIGRGLLYMFDSHYRGRAEAIKRGEYKPFEDAGKRQQRLDKEDIDIVDQNDINRESDAILTERELDSLKSIYPEHMYEYFRSSIEQFRRTWYGRRLLRVSRENPPNTSIIKMTDEALILDQYELLRIPIVVNVRLTLKNVYNYAKSCVHFKSDGEFKQYPRYWRSLDMNSRRTILDRLNNKISDVTSWFNIQGNIRKRYEFIMTAENSKIINNGIHVLLRRHFISYIFESLIYRGVLSRFRPNAQLTNKSLIVASEFGELLERTTLNREREYYQGSYYYLTSSTYSQMAPYKKGEKKLKRETDFFEENAITKSRWIEMYAMNWVSQIGFFHRYLNNRVIFVTGSTGVGKSTQIPKLLLYALKAIDYKNDGSVVCTEPRRKPTVANAERISDELGVPISDKQYYVQYKHKEGEHVTNVDGEHLMLKIVTDGTLLQEIRNPLLKENPRGRITEYKPENQYDIVIVDEAHEHKQNMDLILTLMRPAAYYNNDIKLVIISATMDEDEPYFKRYYRDINDNRLFPLNMMISENKLDRINVERRFHISPPGETTIAKIEDNYVPRDDPVKLIKKIMTGPNPGTLLYFQPGTQEINDEIVKLNTILPANMIAVPLHSKLSTWQKSIFEHIDDQLKNLHLSRNIPVVDWNEENNKRGTASYDYAVLVATNIAEASITIASLKYVVDSGTQKTSYYDFSKGGTILKLTNISESSRIQRRGRVGRTGPGTVYYLYPKNTMINNKIQYEIAISDIHLELFGRLREKSNEISIFDSRNDPNLVKNLSRIKLSNLTNLYKRGNITGIEKIISSQYFLDGELYDYVGNLGHYDYENSRGMPLVYPTGYSLETLVDSRGEFYLIHPEELNMKRNIVGKIVSVNKDAKFIVYHEDHYVTSGKMLSFCNTLLDDLFISARPDGSHLIVEKTDYGKGMIVVQQELSAIGAEDFDVKYVAVLLNGMNLGIGESIIRLISMNMATRNDFVKSAIYAKPDPPYTRYVKEVKLYVGERKSDSDAIIYILNEFHKFLDNNKIVIDIDTAKFQEELGKIKKDVYLKLSHLWEKEEKTERGRIKNSKLEKGLIGEALASVTTEATREYMTGIADEINLGKIDNSDKLSNADFKQIMKRGITTRILMKNIYDNFDKIQDWAKKRSLKIDTIKDYLIRYLKFKNVLFRNENGESDSFQAVKVSHLAGILRPTLMDPYNIVGTADNKWDVEKKLLLSLMRGFQKQIVRKLIDQYYMSIYEPTISNVFTLDKLSARSTVTSTLVDDKYLQSYLLYLDFDQEKNTIGLLQFVDLRLMKYVGYIYTQDMVYNKYRKYLLSNVREEVGLPVVNREVISYYKKGVRDILYDLLNAHDIDIWLKLISLFDDKAYLESRRYHDSNYKTMRQFSIQQGIENTEEQAIDLDLVKHMFKKFEKKIISR
ncbi:MAG: HrpA-like RNA helicase [Hyperionvirus sp.]|uniref:HrpA-like RNA helicase n=1 Tax=Hyperionvirus sp. TaxID=2487770 RepID=A0A3G5A8K9_9VIRU|nr:MAG: HrpA-like RNA helicase [Hyperionvirus sp.]